MENDISKINENNEKIVSFEYELSDDMISELALEMCHFFGENKYASVSEVEDAIKKWASYRTRKITCAPDWSKAPDNAVNYVIRGNFFDKNHNLLNPFNSVSILEFKKEDYSLDLKNKRIIDMSKTGCSVLTIANFFDLTEESVKQIIKNYG